MKAGIFKLLLQSHADGDETSFRKAALQLAASESNAGHSRVADEIRAIMAKMPATSARKAGSVVDIATPCGDLADILEGGHRDERLRDIIAGEMGLPLMTVRFDALFSRFLGATAVQLRTIFAEMPRRPGVYLFDEFDSVAKARGDSQDVGEMNRVVTAFLQLVDADVSGSILVAATNHVDLLDRAVFRRFDVIVPFEKPTREQLTDLLKLRLGNVGLTEAQASEFATRAEGWSFADVARACDDAVRTMALEDREEIIESDIAHALQELKRRELPVKE